MTDDPRSETGTALLRAWGWDHGREVDRAGAESDDTVPARVISQHRGFYRIVTADGDMLAVAPGRMLHRASGRRDLPAVGDWVLARPETDGPATIVAILPRRTEFVRRKAGTESQEQVVAANVDVVFLVSSLNQELNPRRIERYLVATRESGAEPVIVLTKSDLVQDAGSLAAEVRAVAGGADVVVLSNVSGEGIEAIRAHLRPGRTIALLGSSGVGKSTLVNTLAGQELLRTQEIRELDGKGRHTTTHREIYRLACGALLLDTPGMRELGITEAGEGLAETFEELDELVESCRFRDCAHESEPGCAVRAALEAGELTEERWASYIKLRREAAYERRRTDVGAALAEKRRWKQIHKSMREHPKKK